MTYQRPKGLLLPLKRRPGLTSIERTYQRRFLLRPNATKEQCIRPQRYRHDGFLYVERVVL